MTAKPITAALVRETLRSNPTKAAGLSPEALHTIAEGARGNLHAEAIAAFNKGRKADRRYVRGASKTVTAKAKADAAALRAKAVASGVDVGARGPLPEAAKVVLGLSKA